jgi:hypothetical protein
MTQGLFQKPAQHWCEMSLPHTCHVATKYFEIQLSKALMGQAMAQAVSYQPLKAETQIQIQDNQCGICA